MIVLLASILCAFAPMDYVILQENRFNWPQPGPALQVLLGVVSDLGSLVNLIGIFVAIFGIARGRNWLFWVVYLLLGAASLFGLHWVLEHAN